MLAARARGSTVIGLLALAGLACLPSTARAARLTVHIATPSGEPVSQAVVVARPTGSVALPGATAEAAMVQQGQSFNPAVMAVAAGARVSFPNRDRMRHHIYSFSEAKRFEVRLYSGEEVPTLVFDKPGVITLGCNIHDWMQGYIFVSASPWFALTGADGVATIDSLPDGTYEISLWHPSLGEKPLVREAGLPVTGNRTLNEVLPALALLDQVPAHDDPLTARFRHRTAPVRSLP